MGWLEDVPSIAGTLGKGAIVRAYILIEAVIGRARDVARTLSSSPQVTECYLVTGPFDVIAVIEGTDANEIGSAVTSNVHGTPGVARTVTCLAVDIK